jgi:uncharacterized membrane protein
VASLEDAVSPLQGCRGRYVSRSVNQLHDETSSFGDRLADDLARVVGSWTFVVAFVGLLVLWIGLNSLQLLVGPLDPYPYLLLNLVLSGLAAVQSPLVLMRQNRQAARDRLRAEQEYVRAAKAELEIEQIREGLDQLRETQWLGLIDLQQQQIALLLQLVERRDAVPTVTNDAFDASTPSAGTSQDAARGSSAPPSSARKGQPDRRRAGRRRIVRVDAAAGAETAEDSPR